MPRSTSRFTSLLLCGLVFAACEQDGERRGPRVEELVAELGLTGPTFAGQLPAEVQTALKVDPTQQDAPALSIDASGERVFFPLEEEPRKFVDHEALADFFRTSFGAASSAVDDQTLQTEVAQDSSNKVGPTVAGTYFQIGRSFFYDPNPGLRYEVVDPLLAHLGGVSGKIVVGTESMCIDVDSDCEKGYPSYLEPVGFTTAPTHLEVCGSTTYSGTPVCVRHHSFFNSTWFFGDYRRHGSNIRMTTWAALPSTVLTATSSLRQRRSGDLGAYMGVPGLANAAVGEDAVEMAWYCWGSCSSTLRNATAVCGETSVRDPDVNSSARTGNGPDNASRCPM